MEYINAFLVKNIYEVARSPKEASNIDLDACLAVDELYILLGTLPCPSDLQKTKQKRDLWEKRLTEITQAYYHYILSIRVTDSAALPVSINSSSDSSYYTRLDKFRRELGKWSDSRFSYSLHL